MDWADRVFTQLARLSPDPQAYSEGFTEEDLIRAHGGDFKARCRAPTHPDPPRSTDPLLPR